MSKTLRLVLNLLLAFALLAGSTVPAAAASPSQTGSPSPSGGGAGQAPAALEPPPQRMSLQPGPSLLTASSHTSGPAAPAPADPAWTIPVPDTCVVNSQLVNPAQLNFDLYVFNASAGAFQPVFNSPVDEVQPRFNHGCTSIVYTSAPPSPAKDDLYRINPDGSGLLRLTQNKGNNYDSAWSRDGKKIAFTSDRDRQAEVYVMNADGSGQTRLTFSGGDDYHNYDGMPAWSPDGAKIAFVSNRTGGYRIWVMNANGSNPVQLSTLAYSFRPQWSLDGSTILFDAGYNVNGYAFQRLFSINADGTNQQFIDTNLSYLQTADDMASGWSPDGQYYYYTTVYWVQNPNDHLWYWSYAYDGYRGSGVAGGLTPGSADWYPSWETYDNQVPVTNLNPLPAVSPGPVNLSWTVQDLSLYRMKYDVQVKDGNRPWVDFASAIPDTQVSFDAMGGHTYAFRLRATDGFYNQAPWPAGPQVTTTVEALPPVSSFNLTPFSQGRLLHLTWGSFDPGGSGAAGYDVQYRPDSSPDWITLFSNTTQTETNLAALNGLTYDFRVRAIDRAHNQESWPASATGSLAITPYADSLTGKVHDASGVPIPGASPTFSQAPIFASSSAADGSFAAYLSSLALDQTVSWAKTGYGSLPPTPLAVTPDQSVDVYLPPADNTLQNGDFESVPFDFMHWSRSGQTLPTISHAVVHSGSHAALLGADPGFSSAEWTQASSADAIDIDRTGVVHLIDGASNYYTRQPGGAWSLPEALPISKPGGGLKQLIRVDNNLTVHIWTSDSYGNNVSYIFRQAGGSWVASVLPANLNLNFTTNLLMDPAGNWYVLYPKTDYVSGSKFLFYQVSAGVWGPPETIASSTLPSSYKMALGPAGKIGVVFYGYLNSKDGFFYSQRSAGSWSTPVMLNDPNAYYPVTPAFDLLIAKNGEASVVLGSAPDSYSGVDLYFFHLAASGVWSGPLKMTSLPTFAAPAPRLAEAPDGSLFLTYLFSDRDPLTWHIYPFSFNLYTHQAPDGSWSEPARIPGDIGDPLGSGLTSSPAQLIFDPQSRVHFIWGVWYAISGRINESVISTRMNLDGSNPWTDALPDSSTSYLPTLTRVLTLPDQTIGVIYGSGSGVILSLQAPAPITGDSTLSQTLTVPPASANPGLSFVYQMPSNLDSASTFSVTLTAGGDPLTLFATHTPTNGWVHQWLDLSAWAGQSVSLAFTVHDIAGSYSAGAYLDEVSVGTTYPDAYLSPSFPAYAPPGSQVTIPIFIGNQGRVPAGGAQLMLTLPAGVTFVHASVDPLTTSPTLTWDLGDLAAQSTTILWVTLQLDASLPAFTSLSYATALTLASPELETANNTSAGVINTYMQVFLPLLKK